MFVSCSVVCLEPVLRWQSELGHSYIRSIVAEKVPQWPDGLHDWQLINIAWILDGEDVLCITATGDGKSAIYSVAIIVLREVAAHPDKYPTPSPQKADLPPSTPHRNGINGDGISEHSSPSENSESAEQPDELWAGEYTRRPPVIYGLFVVNTSVMVLTIDSAKEQDAAGSYQVEVGFSKRGQDVWNAPGMQPGAVRGVNGDSGRGFFRLVRWFYSRFLRRRWKDPLGV